MDAMKVKLACTAHLPVPEAFSVYAGLMGLDDSIGIRTIPIRGLCDAIEKDGEMLALIEPGGRHFECRAPMVIGPANTSSLGGRIRRVVAGRIDNAIVHSRTGAFTRNGELVMDVQGDELDAVPAELAFDPVIFDRQGGMATCLDDSHPGRLRHMREAWSLLGINSVSFGHWIVEQLLQFIAGMDIPEFQGVPLLVDENIPPQHLQSLELLGAGRFQIVTVPRGQRVAVESLYVVTNFPFAPHLLRTDRGVDASHFVCGMDTVARLFAKAGARVDALLESPASSPRGKLFWARVTGRHRKIDNFAPVESYLSQLGCVKYYPEQLEFGDQVRLIRSADRIVVQNGSASHALLFARPGTEVVMLSHPALPFMAIYAEILAQLGIDFRIVTGPFTRKGETYLDQSDYEIPLQRLAEVIGHWVD